MTKHLLALALTLLMAAPVHSKVRLPHVIGDCMILQQQAEARLWGWAKPGSEIKVSVSWSKKVYRTKTGEDGKWLVKVLTPAASYTPLSISFDDGENVTICNVLAGEVWVCAGQSNMEFPVRGFNNCPLENYAETVASANDYKGIHYVKVPSVMSMTPLEDADCNWQTVNPATVSECSAVGYFFARVINKALEIPVGLVIANKGGTRVESWLDRENLRKYTSESLDSSEMAHRFSESYHYPLLWGNGTFHPILNYTVKGILYYQGCSNVGNPGNQYSDRLRLLADQWRRDFQLGEIPFYIVQIAPYVYGDGLDGVSGALLREQQVRAADIIPHSGIVCTNDLVYPWEKSQIHPCRKQPVGERLAYLALNHDYGLKNLYCESPRFKEMEIGGDTCYVRLKNDFGGISRFEDIEGFEVAGADKVFHKATAGHFWRPGRDARNETIFVTSPEVKKPVAVRYCFKNFQVGNLKNNANLPLLPFRTDNWQ